MAPDLRARARFTHWTKARTALWALVLFAVLGAWIPQAVERPQKVELSRDEFRALIISKLLPYISEWPDSDNQILITILGKEACARLLRELVGAQKIQGREVVVKEIENVQDIGKCHILFIPANRQEEWQELKKPNVLDRTLAVGEAPNFASARQGGALRLVYDEKTVEVNPQNAKRAGYEINSKLLKIFKIVK
jgi:hypothetical protein